MTSRTVQSTFVVIVGMILTVAPAPAAEPAVVPVYGEVVDADTGRPLAARLYLRGADGKWHFPKSVAPSGSAVRYEKRSGFNTNAVEFHTTLSPHMWVAELAPGGYTAVVERGKEWTPLTNRFTVADKPVNLRQPIRRWVNMAERGWFSGDAHNHRAPAELESAMLAEDVNVALPMIDWTTVDTVAPSLSDKNVKGSFGAKPVVVDPTHVWFPRNTEYEIFRSGGKAHTLGAFLIVGHRERFDVPVFPLRRVSERAHAEGGLIDLEKHNWPWSVAIVPVLKPDLFELANNHHWRVEFGVRNWAVPAPPWMKLAGNGSGTDTELAWTHYGFETYYALLNCGFRLQPTAGTANGVHPVPLGFSRVYVHCDGGFGFDKWMKGLATGRSFVTTGPMALATMNGKLPGEVFKSAMPFRRTNDMEIAKSPNKTRWELVQNGDVVWTLKNYIGDKMTAVPVGVFADNGMVTETSWFAFRCFEETAEGRIRFAHTAPWRVEIEGRPLRPKREQAEWFVKRTEEEIARNTGVIPTEGLAEFHEALAAWRKILATAQ